MTNTVNQIMNEIIMCAPSINGEANEAYLEALFLKRLLLSENSKPTEEEVKSSCSMIRERMSNIKKGVAYIESAIDSIECEKKFLRR